MTDEKNNTPPCELTLEDMPRPGSAFSAASDQGASKNDCGCVGGNKALESLTFGRLDFNSTEFPNEGATLVVDDKDIGQLKAIAERPEKYQQQVEHLIKEYKQLYPNLVYDALSPQAAKEFAQSMLSQYKNQGIDVDSVPASQAVLPRNSFTKTCHSPNVG